VPTGLGRIALNLISYPKVGHNPLASSRFTPDVLAFLDS
jgi:hypothetical protein